MSADKPPLPEAKQCPHGGICQTPALCAAENPCEWPGTKAALAAPTEQAAETPETDKLLDETRARHKRDNVDDFGHYYDLTGVLAKHARQLEAERDKLRNRYFALDETRAALRMRASAAESRAASAEATALERAAKVCDDYKCEHPGGRIVAAALSRAIRALAKQEPR